MKLPCLFCAAEERTITVDVNSGQELLCVECDREFTAADAAARLDQLNRDWAAVLAWLASHPERGAKK